MSGSSIAQHATDPDVAAVHGGEALALSKQALLHNQGGLPFDEERIGQSGEHGTTSLLVQLTLL